MQELKQEAGTEAEQEWRRKAEVDFMGREKDLGTTSS